MHAHENSYPKSFLKSRPGNISTHFRPFLALIHKGDPDFLTMTDENLLNRPSSGS
jgi:hypothetical protein